MIKTVPVQLIPRSAGIVAIGIFSLLSTVGHAITILSPSDIMILGGNTDSPDGFAFVTWVALDAGTQIGFTDGSYLGSGNWNGNENFATYQVPTGGLAAGTVVVATDSGSNPQSYDIGGSISGSTGRLSGISNGGDQVFAFQRTDGTVATTIPFNSANSTTAAFLANHTLLFGLNISNTGFITSGSGSSNLSYRPDAGSGAGLLDTTTSFSLNAEDAQYSGPRTGLTIADYKTALLNSLNWATSTNNLALSSTDFAIVPEPSALGNLIFGIAGIAGWRRFRRVA